MSPYSDTVSSGNCYRYEYVVSDNVGNQATIGPSGTVQVDTGSPTFAITKSGSNTYTDGSANVWVKTGTSGSSFTLTATESVSGIKASTVNFPSITGWTKGSVTTTAATASVTYTETTGPGTGAESASVASNAGNSATLNYTITADNTAPTGSVSVPASSTSTSVSVTFSATDNTGGSGVNTASGELMRASATLSNGTCGSFGSYAQVGSTGLGSPDSDTVSSGNCYRYEYVVSDNLGNTATIGPSGSVQVDTGSPTFAITSSGSNTYTDGSANVWVKTGTSGSSFTLTATESDSGIDASTVNFPSITGWTKGSVTTTATTASVAYTETTSPGTGSQSASVASNAGNSTTLNYTITSDTNTLTQGNPGTSHSGPNYHATFDGTATSTPSVTVYYCTGGSLTSCGSSSGTLVGSVSVTGSSSWTTGQVNVTHGQAYTSQAYQTDSDGIALVSSIEHFTP